jgi:hypothetical protein
MGARRRRRIVSSCAGRACGEVPFRGQLARDALALWATMATMIDRLFIAGEPRRQA